MSTVHHQQYLNTVYTRQVFVILVLLSSARDALFFWEIVHLFDFHYKNIRTCRKSVNLLSAGKTKESYRTAVNMAAVRFKMSEPAHYYARLHNLKSGTFHSHISATYVCNYFSVYSLYNIWEANALMSLVVLRWPTKTRKGKDKGKFRPITWHEGTEKE